VDGETFHTVIMHDISGRVEAQREVAEAHARYQSLVENSASGVGLFEGFRFRFANPRLANMLGVADPRDLLDVDVIDFVPAEFQARVKESFRRRHADRRAELPPIRTRLSRRDGGVIDVEAIGTVIELDGRELLQAEIRDVTNELRALEEVRALNRDLEARVEQRTAALTETNRHLQRANADLESFGYTVAHDLRAPLRSMSGFATLMSLDIAEGNTADLVTHAGRIVGNAAKMNALIDGLLAVARAAHENMARKRVEMSTLVEEVLADTGARGRARVDVEALPAVEADPVAMRQIWVNLVSNALKYSAKRAQPAIAIGCVRSATEIAFHVRDNGCGFDPAYAQKLFGNFQRLHAGTEYEGTGIGLAIVRGLVERHGGRVWAEGAVDAGATFHFALLVERLA
jgi:PAS domain S-box-containing protein